MLAAWRLSRELDRFEASRLLGVRAGNLKRYEEGRAPSLRHAVTIERETGGAVYCAAWTEDPV